MLNDRAEHMYEEKSEAGRAFFTALLQRSECGRYDATYLVLLEEYRRLFPDSENVRIFYARHALAHGDTEAALAAAQEAYAKKKYHYEVWKILIECYRRLGDMRSLLIFEGISSRVYRTPIEVPLARETLEESLALLSVAMGVPTHAPYTIGRARMGEDGLLALPGAFAGEFLPTLRPAHDEYRYWSGIFVEMTSLDAKAALFEALKADPAIVSAAEELVFDVMKVKQVDGAAAVDVCRDTRDCIGSSDLVVPLAGTESGQEIFFRSASLGESSMHLGKWVTSFFRLSERTELKSSAPFMMGEPVRLGHSPKRKRLILHILVDALCWPAMKRYGFAPMPNLMRFFSKGIIFNNHFSAAEYTYPSLASIETGMYLHHNQVFNEMFGQEIDPSYVTISERMKERGYLCVNVMGEGDGIYNGVTRGFDRIIVDATYLPGYEAVERTIRHIEAFDECDQFLWMHFADPHVYSAGAQAPPTSVQTHLPLGQRMEGSADQETSVNLPSRPIYIAANRDNIRHADRVLGVLFEYLENHFSDDEYIVHLYSDHGVPVYEAEPYLTSEKQAGAALMMRGGDIPARGIVQELTSGVDIYHIVAHNVGFPVGENTDGSLPAALGGKERAYVISNSIYPGKRYELGIRTSDYEFRLASEDIVGMDGTVDLADAKMAVWKRTPAHENVDDEEVFQYFYRIAAEFTRGAIDHEGHRWPEIAG